MDERLIFKRLREWEAGTRTWGLGEVDYWEMVEWGLGELLEWN